MVRLRPTKIQAARDLFLLHHELILFEKLHGGEDRSTTRELITESKKFLTERRSRSALLASVTCMFFQQVGFTLLPDVRSRSMLTAQFCGVNIMAYYSTTILLAVRGVSAVQALSASLGFGIINWLVAIPALWAIDSFGRRKLLLSTFPFMAACNAMIAIAFYLDDDSGQVPQLAIAGMLLFSLFYSIGEGPVPFVSRL